MRKYVAAQASVYFTAGIFLAISHYTQYFALRYLGHLLIALSIIMFVTTVKRTWMCRIANGIDIVFLGSLDIIAFLALSISIIEEQIVYRHSHPELAVTSLGESSLWGVMLLIILVFVLIPIVLLVFHLRKRRLRLRFRASQVLLSIPRMFSLFAILFIVTGFISIITSAFPPVYFWGPAISFITYAIGFSTGSHSETRRWYKAGMFIARYLGIRRHRITTTRNRARGSRGEA